MNRSNLRYWPLLVGVLLIAMACSAAPVTGPGATQSAARPATSEPVSGSAPLPTSTLPSALPGETAFDQVIAMLGPEGDVSPEMAVQAFALAVAPLPGVTPPAGPNEWPDADAAVAWVAQVWDQLTASQQTAIDRALDGMPDPFSDSGAASASAAGNTLAAWRPATAIAERDCGLAGPGAVDADISPAVRPYLDMMKDAAGSIAGHLRRPSLPRLAVCLVSPQTLAGPSLTRVFDAEHSTLGQPASCSIFLNADIVGGLGDDLGYLMAFNTFLCFSTTANATESLALFSARKVRTWVLGGTAAWAGATVASEVFGAAGGEHLAEVWSSYLTEPGTHLYLRTASAIGFMSQVDQDLPSAWDVIDEMLLGADGLDSIYAATGRRQSFIDLWAAGFFRDASRGPDWDIVGPGIPADTAEAGSIEVANGATEEMAAPEMAVAIADLTTSADVTVLAGNHLRVHDGVQDLKDVRNQAYCTMDGGGNGCICPQGTPGAGRPPLPSLGLESKLALTGMEFGGTATIQGVSLEDYCGSLASPEPSSAQDVCSLLSDAEVTAVIGVPIARQESDGDLQAGHCLKGTVRVEAGDPAGGSFVSFSVSRARTGLIAEAAAQAGAQTVTGLGDEAVFLPNAGVLIGAGSGVEFTLQVAKVWQVGTQADAVGLARIMLSRL
ncbi:hypothetical protein BH24CHL5_BH24CHL5_06920 [soil metagenome]